MATNKTLRDAWIVALGCLAMHADAQNAEDRSHFEAATAKRCLASQRQDPVAAQRSEASQKAYCDCYAADVARTMPHDVFNTSQSAATPEQSRRLQQLMEDAGRRCSNSVQ